MKMNSVHPLIKKKLINLAIFVLFSIAFEIAFFALSFKGFLPPLFFLDLLFCLFIGSVILLFKKPLFDYIYIPILLLIVCACFYLNTLFYNATKQIFILEYLGNLESIFRRAQDHKDAFSVSTLMIFISVYVTAIIIFIVFNALYKSKAPDPKLTKRKHYLLAVNMLVGSLSIYALGLNVTAVVERNSGNSTIDFVSYSSEYTTKKIGLLSYYVKNLERVLFPAKLEVDQLINYFTDSKFLKDDYTGILNGYNVVAIEIEAGAEHVLNEYVTPNLYELFTNGVHCETNYSANTTMYSEMLGIVGCHPSFDISGKTEHTLPFSLPSLLNNENYNTCYCVDLHSSNDISNQIPLMPDIGFKKCLYHDDLLPGRSPYVYEPYYNFPRDSDVIKLVIEELNKTPEPFYLHHSTICMHYDYDDSPARDESLMKGIKEEFDQKLTELENSGDWVNPITSADKERYRNYTLCSMDLDKAVGMLVNSLKERGILDKTLIVLYGDHDCFGGHKTQYPMSWQIAGKKNMYEIANYPTLLGFYNPTLNELYAKKEQKLVFEKFSSPMVIVPTVLDLLGVKYNPKFYQGKSIFDPTYGNEIFYSMKIKRFMNENYLSEIGQSIDKIFDDNDTEDIFLSKCKNFLRQTQYLDYIFKNNIFAHYDYNRFLPLI